MDTSVLIRPAEKRRIRSLLTSQKFAYLVVGGINTLVGFVAFVAWIHILGERFYTAAVVLSYCVSIVIAFGLHRTFVFKVKGNVARDFAGFVAVNSTGLLLNMILMFVTVGLVGIPPVPAQVIVLGLVAIASYYGHRTVSFRRTSSATPVASLAPDTDT